MKKLISILVLMLVVVLCVVTVTSCDTNKKQQTAPNEYTIVYSSNGGSGNIESVVIKEGDELTLPTCTFTAPDGKVFRGWSIGTRDDKDLKMAGDKVTVNGNVTVYAMWQYATYDVSFDANGGTGTMSNVQKSRSYTLPACTFTAPSGMSFLGWAVGNKNSNALKLPGEIVSINANTVIYAIWDYNFLINFNANGGTGTMASQKYAGEYTLPENGFTAPTGKRFVGWALTATGSVITTTTINITESIPLYAIWEDIIYNVSFNANGGSGTMQAVQTTYNYELPACTFTKPENKFFKGWALTATGNPIYASNLELTQDVELFAIWDIAANVSEAAMDNFLDLIEEGNYVIRADGYLSINVVSQDLVCGSYDNSPNDNFTVMSLDNDVFYIDYYYGQIDTLMYVMQGNAIYASSERLPNQFNDVDNIWDVFTNQAEAPLTFISSNATVKELFNFYAGIHGMGAPVVTQVSMVLDNVYPSVVHLIATFETDPGDGYIHDVTISFGGAVGEELAIAWMNDSNREYPEAPTNWDSYIQTINQVFLQGYADIALPFPTFATYALNVTYDGEPYTDNGNIIITDPKLGALLLLLGYGQLLVENGFTQDPVNNNLFVKEIRPENKCYSNILLDGTNGFRIVAYKTYDTQSYDSYADINDVITDVGFLELPDNTLTDSVWEAQDMSNIMSETNSCLFRYDLYLEVHVTGVLQANAQTYVQSYINDLVNNAGYEYLSADDCWKKTDVTGARSFRYMYENNMLKMLFKSEPYISPTDTNTMLVANHFPALDTAHIISSKDIAMYQKVQFGKIYNMYLSVAIEFDTASECESYLQTYMLTLADPTEYGFETTGNPMVLVNDAYGLEVTFDYTENSTSAMLHFGVNPQA